jgi:EAL domain-containing protein (putative c-di-GMP-specific phosphodiesterase class I)
MATSAAESITHLDLDSAIKSNQLTASFEPYVSLRKLQARGAELHLVWRHPQYGRLTPSLFMPFVLAEGRSRQITGFMLREAARAAADWRRAGLAWSVSLNLPLEDLADGTLPSMIGVLLDEFELPPETFIIDVGEADLVARSAQALPAITGLRALGCGVALDSAPGEAMIQDLRGLPFTEIKVSGAAIVQFVDRTRHSGTGRVAARVYNARSHDMPVTAVGVDSEAMLWSVQRLEFDAAQGPYICGPTEAGGLVRWEKIWREAAENIRNRKVSAHRPLAAEAPLHQEPPAAPPHVEPEERFSADPEEPAFVPEPEARPDVAFVEEARIDLESFDEADEPAFEEPPAFLGDEPAAAEAQAAEPEAPFEPLSTEEAGVDPEPSAEADELALEKPLEFLSDEPTAAPPQAAEPAWIEEAAAPLPGMPSLPAEEPDAPAPAGAEGPALIARKLPGIAKPIVMTVQNQGPERFNFLKRLARKG